MKRLIPAIVILIFIFSCRKQENFSIEKLYIIEYNYEYGLDNCDTLSPFFKFKMIGFSELGKNLNFKYASRLTWDSYYFYDQNTTLPDSIKSKLFEIVTKFQRDTAFLYTGEIGSRIYDGNSFRFIFQYSPEKIITIKFEPKFLPEDLKYLYDYLYGNRQKTEHQSKYNDHIQFFDSLIYDELPPPPIRNTIKFLPPKIEADVE